jgi:glycosyltransferase involved in cell wall biosynthesis
MLTVVIPTYNRANYLSNCLDSLVSQDYPKEDFEVIVIDDGSLDETKKIAESFQDKLDLRYFFQDHQGVSLARNKGIDEARGEVVVFFDDDALAQWDWLSSIKEIMKTENIITGRVEPIHDNIWKYFAPHYNQGAEPKESAVLLEGNCAIAKKVFADVGKFDAKLTYGHEGREFLNRAKQKYRIKYYPNMVIKHDYAFGLANYFHKQYSFGHKMAYLKKTEIKSIMYLLKNQASLKKSGNSNNRPVWKISFGTKLMIFVIAKVGNFFHLLGAISGYLKYRK